MENKLLNREIISFRNGEVSFNKDNILYVIDWNEVNNEKEYRLIFEENTNIHLLEYGNPPSQAKYDISKNANVNISIVSINKSLSSNRQFDTHMNAILTVALADFSEGHQESSFMFDILESGVYLRFHLAALSSYEDRKEFAVSFNHFVGDTYAEMNNYGVCEDHSSLTFSGVGHIYKGAKRSKTHQNAKIMVFSPHSRALANPILKIDENDVEASHAAAVGKVNDEHLFYLTSRGLTEDEAKQLITFGYLKPILQYFDEQESQLISDCIERRLK